MAYTYTQYAIADISSSSPMTGTVTTVNASGAIVGAGTLFTVEQALGDIIYINGQYGIVYAIADNTHLTATPWASAGAGLAAVHYAWSTFGFGGRINGVVVPPPKGTWIPYTKLLPLGNALVRAGGWKGAEWVWGFLTQVQREGLRWFVGGPSPIASAAVLIVTRVYEADAYHAFTGNAIWSVKEDRQSGRRLQFTLPIQALVQIDL